MRIAQVAPLYESVPPKLYGGTERVVSWLTEELVSLGHEVTLFASGDSLTNARLVPVCPEALRLTGCVDPLAHHVQLLDRVLRERHKFDLIHFHIDYLHFPVSRSARLPQVTTVHGSLDIPDLVPLYREFAEMRLVSISKAQRIPLPWANWLGTVHHGLPPEALEANLSPGQYLAFLGRISPEKGLENAIDIARRCGVPLKIAAKIDPKDQEFYEHCITPLLNSQLIEFVGEISDHEKNEFLGNASALLFPINWEEPFGIVLIEAMSCGVPIIAYPRGSVPEIIEDGRTGFLVNDVDSAVTAVGRIRELDRENCRLRFEQRFTSQRMARDYVDIYKRVAHPEPKTLVVPKGDLDWKNLELPSSTT